MEKRLNEPEFWSFAAPIRYAPANRIELVFQMARKSQGHDDHQSVALYRDFTIQLKQHPVREVWQQLEMAFAALEEWYEDHTFFHLIGFLSYLKKDHLTVWNVYRKYWLPAQRKDEFRKILKKLIQDNALPKSKRIEDLEYGDAEVPAVLLCFNVASLLADRAGTVRFSFDAFRNQRWDQEHIHARASKPPAGEELEETLKLYRDFLMKQQSEELRALGHELEVALQGVDDQGARRGLYEKCRGIFGDEDEGNEQIDGIGNLTLLDSSTNRGLKNGSFRIKRFAVLRIDNQNTYVPPCTRNVFTKAYTVDVRDLLNWNIKVDGSAYIQTMIEVLDWFFQEAEGVDEAGASRVEPPSKGAQDQRVSEVRSAKVTGDEFRVDRTLSFLDLMVTCEFIEIPLIQRDYAQGRKGEFVVREAFLSSIFEALRNNEALTLDFIYGTSREGDDRKVFHPIDGQQRLTTLFLLYWFAYVRLGRIEEFRDLLLASDGSRFRYRVRPGAERFFPALLKWSPEVGMLGNLEKELPEQIWFSKKWLDDPTVKGALVMLDAINAEFVKVDATVVDDLEERLRNITMKVLQLPGSIQADEIYLRMNARGKELTGFETFKAWLLGARLVDDKRKLSLDQTWLEFLWSRVTDADRAKAVSACYFNTFLALAVNHQAGRPKAKGSDESLTALNEWMNLDHSHQKAKWETLFDQAAVDWVFCALDAYAGQFVEVRPPEWNWLRNEQLLFADSRSKLQLRDRLLAPRRDFACPGTMPGSRVVASR